MIANPRPHVESSAFVDVFLHIAFFLADAFQSGQHVEANESGVRHFVVFGVLFSFRPCRGTVFAAGSDGVRHHDGEHALVCY
jgi:hypothetical protein